MRRLLRGEDSAIACTRPESLTRNRQFETPPGPARFILLPKGTDFAARKAQNEADALRLVPDDRYREFIEERISDAALRTLAYECLNAKDCAKLNVLLFPPEDDPTTD